MSLRRGGGVASLSKTTTTPSTLGPAPDGASRAARVTVATVAASPSSTAAVGAGGGGVVGVLISATTDGASSARNGTGLVLGGWG
jgi:hypothetical protein